MPKNKNEESDKQFLSQLIARESLQDEPSEKATEICSLLVDLSTDYDSTEGARTAIRFIDELIEKNEPDTELLSRLYYIQGNAWLVLDDFTTTEIEGKWDWGREFLERAILSFRRSRREDGFSSFDKVQQSSVLTNLANQFDVAGRFIRSSQVYNEACSCESGNGMPLLNRGISFWHYARQHYDMGHSHTLAWHAHSDILASLEMKLETHATKPARQILQNIRAAVDPKILDHDLEFPEYSLGDEDESAYRQWCLSNRLFLNSLNDCCTDSVAARDILHLPSLPTDSKFGLGLHGFFNQMKQEFVAGRYFLYEALHNDRPHFSDRDVMLYNTLDYPVLGLFAEKARWAFRSAASVLDKIAVFLAKYLNISKRDKIDFRLVWYQRGDPKFGLRPCFASRKNWPWRGLFWLSKDLYKVSLCGEDLDPDSTQMRSIRNGLEHRYVKILEYGELSTFMEPFKDNLAEAYSRTEFLEMALRYLCYAREAIIYLALGIEADQRISRSSNEGLVLPIPLDLIEDESKF